VQSPDEAAAREMPRAAIERVHEARVLPLAGIAELLKDWTKPRNMEAAQW
jgi:hypothetical protein